ADARGGVGFAALGGDPQILQRALLAPQLGGPLQVSFRGARGELDRLWSPWPSMPKKETGLPVWAMPSATFFAQVSSMPITTTAATFGFEPVPMSVRKCSSRSAPNCSRP